MPLTYGFYTSRGGDRRYSAKQFSSIFDGLITDGVYYDQSNPIIAKHFNVTADTNGLAVLIDSGRAWLKHTWCLNETKERIALSAAGVVYTRTDAVVIRVDAKNRVNTFAVVKGAESAEHPRPSLTYDDDNEVYDFPLAYVDVRPGVTAVSDSDIVNAVGWTREAGGTPYVTGIIQTTNIDQLINDIRTKYIELSSSAQAETEQSLAEVKGDILEWFSDLQHVVDGDSVTKLETQLHNVERYLVSTTADVVLSHTRWTQNGEYVLYNADITADSYQEILPGINITKEQFKALGKAMLVDGGQSNGQLTLKALDKIPTVDIPVRVIFRGVKPLGVTSGSGSYLEVVI